MIGFVERDGTGRREIGSLHRMTFPEIAQAMGISQQRVHQLYRSAMKKLARADWTPVMRALDGEGRTYAMPSRRGE